MTLRFARGIRQRDKVSVPMRHLCGLDIHNEPALASLPSGSTRASPVLGAHLTFLRDQINPGSVSVKPKSEIHRNSGKEKHAWKIKARKDWFRH